MKAYFKCREKARERPYETPRCIEEKEKDV